MTFYIRKTSGQIEPFDVKKFRLSLHKAGANENLIDQIIQEITKINPTTTKQIHTIASKILAQKEPPIAARYNLKRALIELGPAGYPFEQFIAQVFSFQNYEVKTNVIIPGFCVDHEVDVIAKKGHKHYMVECKFHNQLGKKSNVKVALYIHARFQDIAQAWNQNKTDSHEFHQAWIVTNTQFTTEAIKFALCRNMRLLGWSYPKDMDLARIIDTLGLHPITALTSLSKYQKRTFLKNGWVLCRDAHKYKKLLQKMGFSSQEIDTLITQAEAVCKLS